MTVAPTHGVGDPKALAPAPTADLPYEVASEKAFDAFARVLSVDIEKSWRPFRGPGPR